MKIFPDKTQDDNFEDLGDLGHTGSLNDRIHSYGVSNGYSGSVSDILRIIKLAGNWVVQPLDDAWIVDTNPPELGSASASGGSIFLSGTDQSYGARAYRSFNFPEGNTVRLEFDVLDLDVNIRVGSTASGVDFYPNTSFEVGTGYSVEWTANGMDQFVRFNRFPSGQTTVTNLVLSTRQT